MEHGLLCCLKKIKHLNQTKYSLLKFRVLYINSKIRFLFQTYIFGVKFDSVL